MIPIPVTYVGALYTLAYGWVMEFRTVLAGPIVMLFFHEHVYFRHI